jgi:DNA-binding NarL/FixJ family response regulator
MSHSASESVHAAAHERPKIIIADPDPLARRVLRDALQARRRLTVVAEARDGVEAEELTLHYRPDVLLMEPAIPRLDGIAVTRRISQSAPEVRVILLAVAESPMLELAALRAGASGFLSKALEFEALENALHGAVRGEAAVSRSLAMRLIEHLRLAPEPGRGMRPVRSPLTTREWEVLDLMSAGCSTSEIADTLVLSEDTVYTHVKNLMRKLGAHSRKEAIEAASRMCTTATG